VTGPGAVEGRVVRECVEGYVFVARPVQILILRRPPHRQGGIWMSVAGKVEPSDPDLEAAVRREVREETGFGGPTRVTSLDWHVPFRADNGETWRLHAYALESPRPFTPTLSDEHVAFAWVAPDEAVRRLHYPDNHEAVRRLVARLGAVA
jgi:8-oxo-dGTP pyrophosphatase MutT (NUDIX family)